MNEEDIVDIAREYLSYDPETGEFRWIKRPSNRVKVGDVAGCKERKHGYILIRLNATLFRAHRLACLMSGVDIKGLDVDHADGNPSNNKLSNLRPCTKSQNMGNMMPHKDNQYSKWKGVSWSGANKNWYARIYHNGKSRWLGSFGDEREAAEAYLLAALDLQGEFARGS